MLPKYIIENTDTNITVTIVIIIIHLIDTNIDLIIGITNIIDTKSIMVITATGVDIGMVTSDMAIVGAITGVLIDVDTVIDTFKLTKGVYTHLL